MAPGDEGAAFTGLELADAVEAVRQGLMTGAARGTGSAVRFEVSEIRMEFTVQLSRAATDRGGARAWVVEAGAERTRTAGHTHVVAFTMRPKDTQTGGYVELGVPPRADRQG
jgi:hypothetical protein